MVAVGKPSSYSPSSLLTIARARHLLAQGLINAQELCLYCRSLAAAGEDVWHLNAFAHIASWSDLVEQAQESDDRRCQGQCLSPLDGIPFTIKANLAMDRYPLTAGSRILGENAPVGSSSVGAVGYNAQVVQSLQQSGAIFLGITTMDEFGMGSLGIHHAGRKPTKNVLPYMHRLDQIIIREEQQLINENDFTFDRLVKIIHSPAEKIIELHEQCLDDESFLVTRGMNHTGGESNDADDDPNNNSHSEEDLNRLFSSDYSAGGSSCGAAVSVAHGSSLIALGSDTGGSIRLPAAWCGVVGLKPSYGRLSRHGLVSYASSLDTVGILARSTSCVAQILQQLLYHQHQPDEVVRDSNQCLLSPEDSEFTCRLLENKAESDETNKSSLEQEQVGLQQEQQKLDLTDIVIGIPEAFSVDECPTIIRDAWMQAAEELESHGATIRIVTDQELSPALLQRSLAAYYILVMAEASSNLARYDGFRYGLDAGDAMDDHDWDAETSSTTTRFTLLEHQLAKARSFGFGNEVIRRILCGTAVLSSDRFHTYYESAAKLRALLTRQLNSCLSGPSDSSSSSSSSLSPPSSKAQEPYDVLLVPTTLSFPPPKVGQHKDNNKKDVSPLETYANDVMTVPASLAGLPAVSVPIAKIKTTAAPSTTTIFRPAMQLIGSRLSEARLLEVASVVEERF
ncbi:hypothetical protein ACA910_014462 [Epithemia clementina (nom. ined.)]